MSYPGGKGSSWQQIVNRMPAHRVYIETHLGAGSVLRRKRPADYSIGIDSDIDVVRHFARRIPPAYSRVRLDAYSQDERPQLALICGDAARTLRGLATRDNPSTLVYSDPPYVLSARRSRRACYRHEYSDDQHVELIELLRGLRCAVMVSGYRCDIYDTLLSDWRRDDYTAATRRGIATESLWMNFDAGAPLHDHAHLGGTFRERERIKRKRARWRRRFAELPDAERDAMLRDLLDTSPPEAARQACIDILGEAAASPQASGRSGL